MKLTIFGGPGTCPSPREQAPSWPRGAPTTSAGSRISRADLAQFMLVQVDDLRYARPELRISN
jgi:hypothetical protein